jgi:hypothetical protein
MLLRQMKWRIKLPIDTQIRYKGAQEVQLREELLLPLRTMWRNIRNTLQIARVDCVLEGDEQWQFFKCKFFRRFIVCVCVHI